MGAEIRIHDRQAFVRLLLGGEIGAGEAYMDDLWSSPDLASLLHWAALNRDALALRGGWFRVPARLRTTIAHRMRRNTPRQSRRNIAAHYDLGNDFYRLFLDETMTYSSAVFTSPRQSLADAQRTKYQRIAEGAGLTERHARPRNRFRLGRVRPVCGRRARLSRDLDHDLPRAARPRAAAGPSGRPRGAGRHPAAGLPRDQRHL